MPTKGCTDKGSMEADVAVSEETSEQQAFAHSSGSCEIPEPAKPWAVAMLWKPVLSLDGLDHIQNHLYKAGVYTPLDNILNPMWFRLTYMLPEWVAPNLVTLAGFVPMFISYMLACWYSPNFDTPVPRWLAFYTGFALLLYQTFDAMDGKQARRTHSASPIGQLFDHGCDCLACFSHHSTALMVFLPGGSRWGVVGLAALQTAFFVAQWQEYYTGVLCTSFGPVGVTETQYGLITLALFVGMFGPENVGKFALQEVQLPWMSSSQPLGVLCCQGWVVFCVVLVSISAPKTLAVAGRSGKIARCLVDLVPAIVLNACIFIWDAQSLAREPRLVCFVFGLLFFYYTVQMILFSMAKMTFRAFQPSLLPFAGLALSSLSSSWQSGSAQTAGLVCLATGMFLLVLVWVLNVTYVLKWHLGINFFTIESPKEA